MKETSWRTLMLMTTVLILIVIFQGTVRPCKPKTPLIGPTMGGRAPADCNTVQGGAPTQSTASADPNTSAPPEPEPVTAVAEAHPAWLNDNLGNLNGTVWAAPLESDDSDGSWSSEPDDPNKVSSSVLQ
jgi:hypothetical protein